MSVERSTLDVESSAPRGAVFLSYASQDAEAAERIADALRAAGIEVWFDKSELVGGDSWDKKIRDQIQSCTLFLPVISANTQARTEGYFRLEWRLAEQRTHLMAKGRPFLLPIVIDDTHDSDAHVPDAFFEVQWSRFPGGECDDPFAAHVSQMLQWDGSRSRSSQPAATPTAPPTAAPAATEPKTSHNTRAWIWLVLPALIAGIWYGLDSSSHPADEAPSTQSEEASPADQLVAKAREILSNGSKREGLEAASAMAERAIELDPANAAAWSTAAEADLMMIYPTGYDQSDEMRQRAMSRIARAMVLSPHDLWTQSIQFKIMAHASGSPDLQLEAEAKLRELIAANPHASFLKDDLAAILYSQQRFVEAAKIYEELGEFDGAGWMWLLGGQPARAIEAHAKLEQSIPDRPPLVLKFQLERTWLQDLASAQTTFLRIPASDNREEYSATQVARLGMARRDSTQILRVLNALSHDFLNHNDFEGPRQYWLGWAHRIGGNETRSQIEWRKALKLLEDELNENPDRVTLLWLSAEIHAWLGEPQRGKELLRQAQQIANEPIDSVTTSNYSVHLALGNHSTVMDWLESEMRHPSNNFAYAYHASARFDPEWDTLRGDPRFEKILRDHLPPSATPFDAPATVDVPAKSIAVLAFENRSAEANNEYFSDGISEELLNVLTRVEGLKVTSRTSAFHFKGKDTPIAEIGRQLGVAYVVEGSVRRSGDRVRITAQLINAADGFNVWSQSFDRELKDIFALQDEIAGLVAKELQLKLGITSEHREVNPDAYQLYLEARYYWNQRGEDNFDRAEIALNRALQLDPEFAEAHATLGDVWVMRATYRSYEGKVVSTEIAHARSFADHAISLQPDLSRPYSALGWACMLEGKWDESGRWHRQAVERSPQDAMARFWYGSLLSQIGDFEASERELTIATDLDPLSFIIVFNLSYFSWSRGDWANSYAYYQRSLELREGGFVPAISAMAHCAFEMSRTEEAVKLARQVTNSWPDGPRFTADSEAVWILHQSGFEEEAEAYVEKILPELPPNSFLQGLVLAAVGRWEEALPCLENTPLSSRDWVFDSPVLDPWREDPRFLAMIERWGETERYQTFRQGMRAMREEAR